MNDTTDDRPAPPEGPDGALAFRCPRCATDVTERFYGPCRPCRRQLSESVVGDRRDVVAAPFEPAMHVTPNAVATKD